MKLKLDENLGKPAAEILRRAGHDVATVPEQDLCSATDAALIKTCRREGRCLVTLDLDFANPLRFAPSRYPGIAVLRLPPRPGMQDLSDALLTLAAALRGKEIRGRLWIIQRGRIREYQPEE